MDTYEALKPVMDALLDAKGLDSIMKAAYDVFGNPVILTDPALITLAYHAETPVDDVSWNDNVSHGYSSDDFVERFYREGIMDRIAHSSHPIIIDSGIGEQIRRIHFRVAIDHNTFATFGILEVDRPFGKDDLQLVEEICKILSLELQRISKTGEKHGGRYKGVLYSLLLGKEIGSFSRSLVNPKRFGDSKAFSVLVIDNSLKPLDSYYINSIRRSMENVHPESMSFEIGDQQVLLLGIANEEVFESRLSTLDGLLSRFEIYAGISSMFDNPAEIRTYYLQAVDALMSGFAVQTGDSKLLQRAQLPHMCRYADYLVPIMLSKLENCSDLDDFVVPEFRRLGDYDKTHGTNYTETLKRYFLSGQSIKAVASDMRIHRNTVSQRLAKASKIIGADVLGGLTSFEINLSCYIDEYQHLLKKGKGR